MSTTAKNANWTINKAAGSLSLSTDTLTLNNIIPGTVTVTRVGNGTISATSSNSNVVTVTSVNQSTGVITLTGTGVTNGTATITVSVAAGTNHNAPSNKTINVTAIPFQNLNNYTWAQIAQIIKQGNAPSSFEVGAYKDITFPTEITLDSGEKIAANSTWRVYILGINHNASKEGNNRVHFCIGKTTDGKEICFYGHRINSDNTNSGGWNSSAMKTWLNGTFYNALPTDLKNVITECTKYTDNTGDFSGTSGDVTATSQKIWLLAEYEVLGVENRSNRYEKDSQAQYDYYKNSNSRIRYQYSSVDSIRYWWLRSPRYDVRGTFLRVTSDGSISSDYASSTNGVVPCFTIS